jgi:UDP-N-acetylmuramyl pentapeptide phosphotransferase/UDP-N-acetylglucosamine-1-phosphate transferase
VISSYNLVDVMDGLAAILVIAPTLAFFLVRYAISLLDFFDFSFYSFLGNLVGFLLFNASSTKYI